MPSIGAVLKRTANVLTAVVVAVAVGIAGTWIGWDIVGHWVADWRWTQGWGNLFTVGVAVAALVLATVSSARALRTTREQFAQGRDDGRKDKWRAELASLLSTSLERGSQINLFNDQFTEALLKTPDDIQAGRATRIKQVAKQRSRIPTRLSYNGSCTTSLGS